MAFAFALLAFLGSILGSFLAWWIASNQIDSQNRREVEESLPIFMGQLDSHVDDNEGKWFFSKTTDMDNGTQQITSFLDDFFLQKCLFNHKFRTVLISLLQGPCYQLTVELDINIINRKRGRYNYHVVQKTNMMDPKDRFYFSLPWEAQSLLVTGSKPTCKISISGLTTKRKWFSYNLNYS